MSLICVIASFLPSYFLSARLCDFLTNLFFCRQAVTTKRVTTSMQGVVKVNFADIIYFTFNLIFQAGYEKHFSEYSWESELQTFK